MSDIETTSAAGAGLTGASGADSSPKELVSDDARNRRKVREGQVVSVSMNKTIVVAIVDRVRHGRYSKTIQQTQRLYVHDEVNDAKVGDKVRVMETRPLSKLKRWRLVEIVERAR